MSLKTKLANSNDVTVTSLEVPEWNATVHIRLMSVKDRTTLFKLVNDEREKVNLPVWLVILTVCEANGERCFQDSDFDLLSDKSANVIDRIAKHAAELNGLGLDAVEDAKKN